MARPIRIAVAHFDLETVTFLKRFYLYGNPAFPGVTNPGKAIELA
jgi:hypothetical protein